MEEEGEAKEGGEPRLRGPPMSNGLKVGSTEKNLNNWKKV